MRLRAEIVLKLLAVNRNLTLAILRYVGAPEVEPTTVDTPGPKMDDSLMHVRSSLWYITVSP